MSLLLSSNESNYILAAKALINGGLLGFPTETVYGLAADAENLNALERIFQVKSRPRNNPLIVHIGSIKYIEYWAKEFPENAQRIAEIFWPGPVTMILEKNKFVNNVISANQDSVAIRIPKHNSALNILNNFHLFGGRGIAAPSANKYQKLSPTSALDVLENLGSQLIPNHDYIIDGGQSVVGIESTIISFLGKKPKILRPGIISRQLLESTGIEVDNSQITELNFPGKAIKHYSPNAKVLIDQIPESGQALYAMHYELTPENVIRVGSPKSDIEFISNLYLTLMKCDKNGYKEVVVLMPRESEHKEAILNRIQKMI